ncbi:cell division protein FtsA [Candidatus Saccharibacteria bacterium]|nr:cell division protein FtsA [Candidatus Saccharibacteria bacterium]
MEENLRYVVGIDVGTENVRAVVSSVNREGVLSVVGYNEAKNSGMRKGVPVNLAGPADAIDKMLGEVERMSGYEIHSAFVSVNGAQILTTKTEGMIAVGTIEHEISEEDLARVEDVAVTGRIPANREILGVIPINYSIDGQDGVRDPIGMTGARLEMKANVISALSPNCVNLRRALEGAKLNAESLVPSVVAAGKAVLDERQIENGVAIVDMGAATTSVAIYEEGDLQYVGVIPAGSNNVTNDLAIMLEINTEVAEEIKKRYITGNFAGEKDIVMKINREEMVFEREKVEEVVKARLEEIFEKVKKELRKAGYEKRLPEGAVLVGGGAKMRDIEVFAKKVLEMSVKIGMPRGLGGVSSAVEKPEYAAAVGLMILAVNGSEEKRGGKVRKNGGKKKAAGGGFLANLFSKFKI